MLKNKSRLVWDRLTRILHWGLVTAIAAAWITSSQISDAHAWIGYAAAALVTLRTAWGFVGNRYARFAHFLRSPAAALHYLRTVASGNARRYIGHNPLGGWMVVTLLACTGLLALTGWALGTDMLWGYEWPVRVHVAIAWCMVGLIVLHVSGVLLTGWQHRENLVAAMLSGEKAVPQAGDVD